VRLHRNERAPAFATLDEAKRVFASEQPPAEPGLQLFVGDASVDVWLRYAAPGPVRAYTIASSLDPGLPGQEDTANVVLDYAPGGVKVFRARGLLAAPIEVSRSSLAAFRTFVAEGVRHILEGRDHLLFVICLVLGAQGLRSLLGRVTGFTIGHSVTLSAGFFGLAPSGDWFVPAVELGIALSILYAAAVAVWPGAESHHNERTMFAITAAIGFLHGLGFSFVLRNIVAVTSPDIWQSLLAFNVGVEIGQLVIVVIAWTTLLGARRVDERLWLRLRWGVAAICAAAALVWTVSRTAALLGS